MEALFLGPIGPGYALDYSAGERTAKGEIDYEPLLQEVDTGPRDDFRYRRRWNRRYLFKPRKMRYLLWHGLVDQGWSSTPAELMLFSPGYPAAVTLVSDYIDLEKRAGDDRSQSIKTLHWDAEIPEDTRLQLRSRTGDSLAEEFTFHDRKGEIISEKSWRSLPRVLRGRVDTAVVAGADWSAWSPIYRQSGESFQSPSPRRMVQLEVILSTEDPLRTPVLHSLTLSVEPALLQRARGYILPNRTDPNRDTRFTYTIQPAAGELDIGFDKVRLSTPDSVSVKGVEVRIDGREVVAARVETEGDSLLSIHLPSIVRSDSVEVSFTTRLLHNATLFTMTLGHSDHAGLWQPVTPLNRRAATVFLPDVVGAGAQVRDLEILPSVFTPNGDGRNDRLTIRFAILNVEGPVPGVQIFDLSGHLIARPERVGTGHRQIYVWDGRNGMGKRVAPGIYLLHIDPGAASGNDVVVRPFAVVY